MTKLNAAMYIIAVNGDRSDAIALHISGNYI